MSAERLNPLTLRRSPMQSRLNKLGLALGLAFASITAAQAQSLVELYDAARAYDANYLAARAQVESVQYRVEQSKAALRPSVDLSGGVSRINSEGTAPTSNTTNSQVGVSARMALFNRGSSVTIDQAQKRLEQSKAQWALAEQDLIVRVVQAYFDVLAAKDALNTARANKTAITEQLASAKRNFEVGTATITDTREAQAKFDIGTSNQIFAENDLLTKRVALDQLVGRVGVNPKPLLVPVVLPAVLPADIEEWVSRADGQHPKIAASRIDLEVAKLEIEKAKAGNLPVVGLKGGYTRGHANSNINALNGNKNDLSVGVEASVSLFNGSLTQNQVKEALVLEEKARNDLDGARRQVSQATRQTYLGVQSGLAQVKALEAAESSTKLALEATQLGYKVGVRVNLDVLNAQTQLFQTQRDLAKARYDVLVTGIRLRQAAGQLSAEDVAAVNQLLAK